MTAFRTALFEAIWNGKPRVHATGFAQLYLKPGVRLHVWTDALLAQAPDIKQIVFKHDHRSGIRSHVMHGTLHDEIALPSGDPDAEWEMWEVRPAGEGLPEVPRRVGHLSYACELTQERILTAGDTYEIPKRAFHSTRAIGTTVTIMRKLDEEESWARLLVPKGFNPIHSLAQQPHPSFVRMQMHEALLKVDLFQIGQAFLKIVEPPH